MAESIRSQELLSRASVILFFDYFRNAEEFRADFQARPIRRKRIDFKMQLVFFNRQVVTNKYGRKLQANQNGNRIVLTEKLGFTSLRPFHFETLDHISSVPILDPQSFSP